MDVSEGPADYWPAGRIQEGARLRIVRKGEPDVVVVVDDVRRSGRYGGWTLTVHGATDGDKGDCRLGYYKGAE